MLLLDLISPLIRQKGVLRWLRGGCCPGVWSIWIGITRERAIWKQVLLHILPGTPGKEIDGSAKKLGDEDEKDPSDFVNQFWIPDAINDHPDHKGGRDKEKDRGEKSDNFWYKHSLLLKTSG